MDEIENFSNNNININLIDEKIFDENKASKSIINNSINLFNIFKFELQNMSDDLYRIFKSVYSILNMQQINYENLNNVSNSDIKNISELEKLITNETQVIINKNCILKELNKKLIEKRNNDDKLLTITNKKNSTIELHEKQVLKKDKLFN